MGSQIFGLWMLAQEVLTLHVEMLSGQTDNIADPPTN
jgi:hypothetical protein